MTEDANVSIHSMMEELGAMAAEREDLRHRIEGKFLNVRPQLESVADSHMLLKSCMKQALNASVVLAGPAPFLPLDVALQKLRPGDTLVLRPGAYSTTGISLGLRDLCIRSSSGDPKDVSLVCEGPGATISFRASGKLLGVTLIQRSTISPCVDVSHDVDDVDIRCCNVESYHTDGVVCRAGKDGSAVFDRLSVYAPGGCGIRLRPRGRGRKKFVIARSSVLDCSSGLEIQPMKSASEAQYVTDRAEPISMTLTNTIISRCSKGSALRLKKGTSHTPITLEVENCTLSETHQSAAELLLQSGDRVSFLRNNFRNCNHCGCAVLVSRNAETTPVVVMENNVFLQNVFSHVAVSPDAELLGDQFVKVVLRARENKMYNSSQHGIFVRYGVTGVVEERNSFQGNEMKDVKMFD